jgi:hypothetical protein
MEPKGDFDMPDNNGGFQSGADKNAQKVKELSQISKLKGVGNVDFGTLTELKVSVAPSSLCREYAREYHVSMTQALILETGNNEVQLPFTEQELYVYLSILLRERVAAVNKTRVLWAQSDQDVKIPDFFYLVLAHVGEVIDEQRHLWITLSFSSDELLDLERNKASLTNTEIPQERRDALRKRLVAEYKTYMSAEDEKEFVYAMSKYLRLLERCGAVNGSALPRGLTGEISFMLFLWAENKLTHPEPNVEPGLGLLASLLRFNRSREILNPYISYGPENAYRILLKEVTIPRGRAS